jgi:hypothetical protein
MNEIVWAFDLGKASIGEAVRREMNSANGHKTKPAWERPVPVLFLETLLNRCIRLADREPVCAI